MYKMKRDVGYERIGERPLTFRMTRAASYASSKITAAVAAIMSVAGAIRR